MADMSNAIAQAGMGMGRNIQNTFSNARNENRQMQHRNQMMARQDEMIAKQEAKAAQADQMRLKEEQRQYAKDGVAAIMSADPMEQSNVYHGWRTGGAQRGYDMSDVPEVFEPAILQTLAGATGYVQPKSNNALTGLQRTTDGGMAGYDKATNSYRPVNMGGVELAEDKPMVSITNEAENKGLLKEHEKMAGSRVARYDEVHAAANNAITQNEQLSQLANIDVSTGFSVETRGALASAVNWVLGDGVGDSLLSVDVPAVQAFKAISGRIQNTEMNKAKGPQTDSDARRIGKTLASLGNENEANQFLVKSLQATNARRVEQAEFYDNFFEKNNTLKGVQRAWVEFKSKTPMLSDNVRDPSTGLPMFFNEFSMEFKRRNPNKTREEMLTVWRGLNER